MSFVLDNSVALAWCFEDEQTPAVMALLDRVAETGAMAPLLWPLEAINGLLAAELWKPPISVRIRMAESMLRRMAYCFEATYIDSSIPDM